MGQNRVLVVKEMTFDAAHRLPGYDGPCANMHGHTYRLQIGFLGEVRSDGMVLDFKDVKTAIHSLITNLLDHKLLNEVTTSNFPYTMPTAENMVLWIRDHLDIYVDVDLHLVRLWETPTSYAEWTRE